MKRCLLCAQSLRNLTWGSLVGMATDCLCNDCRSSFQRIDSRPIRTYFVDSIYENALDSILCLYRYSDSMKAYFHHYKFLEDAVLAQVFQQDFKNVSPAVPIPIVLTGDAFGRTFSPVEAFLPQRHVVPLLEKNSSVKQSSKNLTERLASQNPFSLRDHVDVPEEVWLVDDIYTTGTTLHQAAWVLKQAGAKKVHGLCLAETLLKK